MNRVAQLIAIAEAHEPHEHPPGTGREIRGEPIWLIERPNSSRHPTLRSEKCPITCVNYLKNRDAMQAALSILAFAPATQAQYIHTLKYKVLMKPEGVSEWDVHTAHPTDMAQAFLRTLGKWRDS